ncbi:MAG: hypothetical protein CL578_05765 [Alteromonadaceae bacterium]|uniref:Uncharacterized protein n=1 Tax=Paraglaciecola agarilytica NO2 TaxID=1125747 RepID=A0ABQ0I245_9ALTE|nr:hypothetical protein [Paraglaciecola agarilytica]MBN24539.1 hypothetical protein [Alteromonadaceae bacterium]GAC03343.1 hypothetical protein GAGA_0478 [Paraglaciecola agarilytica NO2]|tara:strand:+ start:22521 stop:22832 length:312 start_codon:yes stop_codon:yes gene_type:complete
MSEKASIKNENGSIGLLVNRAALMILFMLAICQMYWDIFEEPILVGSNRFQYFAGLTLIGFTVWDMQKLETFWSRLRGFIILGLTFIVFSPVAIHIWTEMGWI